MKFQGVERKWVATTAEVRGTLPGSARGRAPTMCSVATVEQGGVVQQELATSEEEVAGEGIIYCKESGQ